MCVIARHACLLWMEFVTGGLHDDQLRPLLAGAYEAWQDLLAEVVRAAGATGVRALDCPVSR